MNNSSSNNNNNGGNNPPLPPPNSGVSNWSGNSSYVTQQSFLASYTNSDVARRQIDFPRNLLNRGSIQRELEKERIRTKIIMEEFIQMRALEEEVRRDLMLERELALSRGNLGYGIRRFPGPVQLEPQGVPMLTNYGHQERVERVVLPREGEFRGGFEIMPFQRDPVAVASRSEIGGASELNKDNVIMLPKPTPTLADIKRKAISQPMGGAIEVVKKQKTTEDWSCALCRVSATSERGLMEHLQGKKHKVRQRNVVAPSTGFGTGASSKIDCTEMSKPFSLSAVTATPSIKKDGNFQNASSSNQSVVDENYVLINSKDVSPEVKENSVLKPSATDKQKSKFPFFCEMCNVGAYSKKVFNAHKRGRKHLAKVSQTGDAVQVEACVQNVLMVENTETEMGNEENNDGEQLKTRVGNVDTSVNREESIEKVPEMEIEVEGKLGIKEEVEINVDDVVKSDVIQIEDKKTVLEMCDEEIKEGAREQFGEDIEKVPEMEIEVEAKQGIIEEVKINVDDVVKSDENQIEDEKMVMEMGDEEIKEGVKGEQVNIKLEDVDNYIQQVKDKEKVLEMEIEVEATQGIKKVEINVDDVKSDVPVEACAHNVLMVENMEIETGAEETSEKTEEKQVKTEVGVVNNAFKKDEDIEKVLEIAKQGIKEELAEIEVDAVTNDVNQIEEKKTVLEMGVIEAKEGIEGEQVEINVDVESDGNQTEDKGTVLDMGVEEINEGTAEEEEEEEVETNVSDVTLAEDKKALEIGAEDTDTKEGTKGEQVNIKLEDVDNDIQQVEDKEKVLETVIPDTADC